MIIAERGIFMLAKDVKPGSVINHGGAPHLIEAVSVQTPSARGGATLYRIPSAEPPHAAEGGPHGQGYRGLEDADFAPPRSG